MLNWKTGQDRCFKILYWKGQANLYAKVCTSICYTFLLIKFRKSLYSRKTSCMLTSCNNDSETIYLLAGKAVTCIYIYPFLDPTYAEASCTRHAPIKVAMKMKQLSKNGTAAKHGESLGKDPQSEII